jgi:hypothetical protein
MAILGQIRSEQARQDARDLFNRTLQGWAHDVLRLRAAGLDRPSARTGQGALASPLKRAA